MNSKCVRKKRKTDIMEREKVKKKKEKKCLQLTTPLCKSYKAFFVSTCTHIFKSFILNFRDTQTHTQNFLLGVFL